MLQKYFFIGSFAVLFIPICINARSLQPGEKPTLLIAYYAMNDPELKDPRLPFKELGDFITQSLPNFNIRHELIDNLDPEDLADVTYVFIPYYDIANKPDKSPEQLLKEAGLDTLDNKALIMIQSGPGKPSDISKNFKRMFHRVYKLEFVEPAHKRVHKHAFMETRDFEYFKMFLNLMNEDYSPERQRPHPPLEGSAQKPESL